MGHITTKQNAEARKLFLEYVLGEMSHSLETRRKGLEMKAEVACSSSDYFTGLQRT